MDGDLFVGLERDQLERLARDGQSATKCSRRDLARVLSQKGLGATTVSGTMVAADLAGIDVFVTGGIGGVHRGVEETMDVSADLSELGQTPVVVICAGVKSILDIPRTLEYLETQGVAVMCWKTDSFPAFFTVDSGEKAPMRVETADEVAGWISANRNLGLRSGAIVAVPNPEPADENLLNSALRTALDEVKHIRLENIYIPDFGRYYFYLYATTLTIDHFICYFWLFCHYLARESTQHHTCSRELTS
jgi:pseudouridine-5'-phosphate glycosidase